MIRSSKQISAVFDYFSLNSDESFHVCKVVDGDNNTACGSKISAYTGEGSSAPSRTSNLKRHLQRFHSTVYKLVEENDNKNKHLNVASSSKTKQQGSIVKFFKSDKIAICMTAEKFKKCIVEMVFKNSIPLTHFSTDAFMGLNGEMARIFQISLDRDNIRKLVIEEANQQKDLLKITLHGKFIHLKVDGCTRHRINYFAINVQFVDENQTVIRTLAVRDTDAQHSSIYLKELIVNVLHEFEIDQKQVLSIVTDNARNMIATVDKMNIRQMDSITDCEMDENDDSIDDFIEAAASLFKVQHMRCAEHTLQLAIRDGLKGRFATSIITKLRSVAVAARTSKMDIILKRRTGKGAILDQATRWGSTYLMIQRILELKSVLNDFANPDVTLTEDEWESAEQLKLILLQPFIVTQRLQAANLTPGVFFKEWKKLIFKLSKLSSPIATEITNSLLRRESLLLNNDILLAGIFIDAMVRILLSKDQLARAKTALCEIELRIKGMEAQEIITTSSSSLQEDEEVIQPSSLSNSSQE